jgi:hypothetical protein
MFAQIFCGASPFFLDSFWSEDTLLLPMSSIKSISRLLPIFDFVEVSHTVLVDSFQFQLLLRAGAM